MTPAQINDQFEHGKQDEKHLCRLYLYAGASSGISDDFLESLRDGICQKLQLDEAGFYQAMEKASQLWQAKVDEALAQAENLELIRTFEKERAAAYRKNGILPSKARTLICTRFVLILENLSVMTGKNQLKPKSIARLNALFHDPDGLQDYAKWLFCPALKASQGKWKLTGEKFIFTTLFVNQLFADYLYARQTNNIGLQQIILDRLNTTSKIKIPEIKLFLNPNQASLESDAGPFEIAAHPLAGLDRVFSGDSMK